MIMIVTRCSKRQNLDKIIAPLTYDYITRIKFKPN